MCIRDRVCKTSIRGFNSRPVLHKINDLQNFRTFAQPIITHDKVKCLQNGPRTVSYTHLDVYKRQGLVIVDEQHRFGVQQRFQLMRKPGGSEPDVLVMTATPIPRTLALTVYGDLEVSVIDELPPGRSPVVTRRVSEERADEVWDFVRKQAAAGRQAFLVYPVIEGEKDDQPELDFAKEEEETVQGPGPSVQKTKTRAKAKLRSATEMFDELRGGALVGLRLGLLHGRMSADDKEVTMARFQRGEIDVLLSLIHI